MLGAFWASLGSGWPKAAEAPALGQTIEPTSAEEIWAGNKLEFQVESGMPIRLRGISSSGDRGLQVENGWFVFNWKRPGDEEPYPRFETLLPECDRLYREFGSFVSRHLGNLVQPNLWEVSYVNAIPRGTVWNNVGEWSEILPGLIGAKRETEAGPIQTIRARWVFDLGERRGRLQVHLDHALASSRSEIMLLKLIARGPVPEAHRADPRPCLEFGRDRIVRSFKDITSSKAHEYWRLRP